MNDSQNGIPIDWHDVVESEALRMVRDATVPIYCAIKGNVLQFSRSAVVLRVENDFFLLTAMHDLQELLDSRFCLLTQPGDGNSKYVDLSGTTLVGLGEPVDVAAIRVSPTIVQRMGKGMSALTLNDLDVDGDWDTTTSFVICGYPKVFERQKLSSTGPLFIPRSFTYFTGGYEGPLEKPQDYSRYVHLAVTWSKDFKCLKSDGQDVSDMGTLTTSPKPNGISGGGIWRCGFRTGHEALPADKKYRCKLSAIQHTVNRDIDYAIGTRVSMAVFGIWRDHPALRPAIEAVFPGAYPIIPPI